MQTRRLPKLPRRPADRAAGPSGLDQPQQGVCGPAVGPADRQAGGAEGSAVRERAADEGEHGEAEAGRARASAPAARALWRAVGREPGTAESLRGTEVSHLGNGAGHGLLWGQREVQVVTVVIF